MTETFIVEAHVYIEVPSKAEAQEAMREWVAEHMPSNFVIGWTLKEQEIGPEQIGKLLEDVVQVSEAEGVKPPEWVAALLQLRKATEND